MTGQPGTGQSLTLSASHRVCGRPITKNAIEGKGKAGEGKPRHSKKRQPSAAQEMLRQGKIIFRETMAKPISPKVPKPSNSPELGSGTDVVTLASSLMLPEEPPLNDMVVVIGV